MAGGLVGGEHQFAATGRRRGNADRDFQLLSLPATACAAVFPRLLRGVGQAMIQRSVRLDPRWGGLERVTLEPLLSWSQHTDPGVKYFSSTTTYSKTLRVPGELLGQMAEVPFGSALPFRVRIRRAEARAGNPRTGTAARVAQVSSPASSRGVPPRVPVGSSGGTPLPLAAGTAALPGSWREYHGRSPDVAARSLERRIPIRREPAAPARSQRAELEFGAPARWIGSRSPPSKAAPK
jgi:hypothetical protein